jgi:SAM-dependent methyltransferase
MSSVGHILRWFRGAEPLPVQTARQPQATVVKNSRHSSGLAEFMRTVNGNERLAVLDLGRTSAFNISYLAHMGASTYYNEDLLRESADHNYRKRLEEGREMFDLDHFLAENLKHEEARLDAVLMWDVADYLPESVVKPMVERIHRSLKPGGALLAFFHTQDSGPETPYCRYHIKGKDLLDVEPGAAIRLQRVFNNRHIENLFKGFFSLKFFLARDHVREVLVIR